MVKPLLGEPPGNYRIQAYARSVDWLGELIPTLKRELWRATRGSRLRSWAAESILIYHPENVDLNREFGDRCAVLSEFPSGRRADDQTFPIRNRLVSGLSKAVVVIESD